MTVLKGAWRTIAPPETIRNILWRYVYLLVPGFHNYLIFYRLESREIRLGRLLHGAQDLRDVLED